MLVDELNSKMNSYKLVHTNHIEDGQQRGFIMLLASDLLDNTVPISDFNHGKSSKIFARVMDGATIVVMKNNAPAAVIVDVEEYKRLMEAAEDLYLLELAQERLAKHGPEDYISEPDLMAEFGITQEELDAMPEVELE